MSLGNGQIERDCKGWLQQTAPHSRDRIGERRSLPLPGRARYSLSGPDVGGIKSALLRFQYQETLSFCFSSVAERAKIAKTITRLHAKLRGDNAQLKFSIPIRVQQKPSSQIR